MLFYFFCKFSFTIFYQGGSRNSSASVRTPGRATPGCALAPFCPASFAVHPERSAPCVSLPRYFHCAQNRAIPAARTSSRFAGSISSPSIVYSRTSFIPNAFPMRRIYATPSCGPSVKPPHVEKYRMRFALQRPVGLGPRYTNVIPETETCSM